MILVLTTTQAFGYTLYYNTKEKIHTGADVMNKF